MEITKPMIDFNRAAGAVGINARAGDAEGITLGSDVDMTGKRIDNLPAPQNDTEAATKKYVDEQITRIAEALGITL